MVPNTAFTELVRERVAAWMAAHADQRDPRSDDAIREAYGERYAQLFRDLYHRNRNAAGEAGRRALVYFVAAGAFERLGSFASRLGHGCEQSDATAQRGHGTGRRDRAGAAGSNRVGVCEPMWPMPFDQVWSTGSGVVALCHRRRGS